MLYMSVINKIKNEYGLEASLNLKKKKVNKKKFVQGAVVDDENVVPLPVTLAGRHPRPRLLLRPLHEGGAPAIVVNSPSLNHHSNKEKEPPSHLHHLLFLQPTLITLPLVMLPLQWHLLFPHHLLILPCRRRQPLIPIQVQDDEAIWCQTHR